MGTPAAAAVSLERLLADGHEVVAVYTQPDRPSGRGNKITFSPVKERAISEGISVLQPTKVKTEEAAETFANHNADVAIVVAYGRILPDAFLNAFPLGAINVHFSLLPKYRGAAPVNWAIVNGESETGVTTMRMDAGLDTGDILLQRATAIGADETAPALMQRLSELGAELLSETLSSFYDITPKVQVSGEATYAPIMKREDGLIDWSLSAHEIVNRVRGFQPFPGTYTFHEGARLTLWRAAAEEMSASKDAFGTVIEARGESLRIVCRDSVLRIEELQPEGKRRMGVRDFLNGARLDAGTVLGK